jgi:hypothetical protein
MTPEQELELLRKILAGLETAPPTPPPATLPTLISPEQLQVLGVVLAVIAAVVVLLIIYQLIIKPILARRRAKPSDVEVPQRTGEAIAQAVAHAEEGDLRMAMRQLYLATLLLLDERGLLAFDRTQTNREIVRALRTQPELAQALTPVVQAYDPVWYGRKPINADDFDAFRARIETARAMSPPAPPTQASEGPVPVLPSGGRNA